MRIPACGHVTEPVHILASQRNCFSRRNERQVNHYVTHRDVLHDRHALFALLLCCILQTNWTHLWNRSTDTESRSVTVSQRDSVRTAARDISHARFQVLTEASMKFRVFWDVAPCSHDEVGRRFRGAYFLHNQDESSPR
jgi:hypothetical protein